MTLPTGPPVDTDVGGPLDAPARGRLALPDDPNRRALTLGAIVLAVLLLLFLASRILLGGGEDPEDTALPEPSGPTTTTTFAPTPDGGLPGRPTESFEVFSTKNPFTPLINPPSVGGPASGGTTATTSGGGFAGGGTTQTTIRGGSGTTGGGGTGSGGTTSTTQRGDGASGGQANEPRPQQRVSLIDVLRRNGQLVAQVRVNDEVFTVGEGEVFADNYRVLSIDETNECGRFVFGDEQFRLCRGEETLK